MKILKILIALLIIIISLGIVSSTSEDTENDINNVSDVEIEEIDETIELNETKEEIDPNMIIEVDVWTPNENETVIGENSSHELIYSKENMTWGEMSKEVII